MPLLEELYESNITVLRMRLSFEASLWRNSHRRICSLMRHPIIYNEETKSLTMCPLDGSNLIKRGHLDDPETIKVRWGEFKNRTLPILDYFKAQGIKIKEINAEQSVETVF